MIVASVPNVKTIVREVWKPLVVLIVWDVAVTVFYVISPFKAPSLPLTLFGSALALFLGFRSNSAYQRWWEGRVLWGALINASRSLARNAIAFLGRDDPRARAIILQQIAYVHALRCQLRRQPLDEKVYAFVPKDEAEALLQTQNPANSLLEGTGRRVADALRAGQIDTIQQVHLDAILVDVANAQGGMERLKNTPLPNQYRFVPALFTRLFCLLLPIGLVETLGLVTPIGSTVASLMFLAVFAIGEDLTDPFGNSVHDLPLSSMSRTVEANLLQSLGEEAPPPLLPDNGVLW
ncbi:bestrophin family ion channel [Sphingomonas sp. BIUV-7]|uniref:Bestrophin family ion channel n=1 Tax=Sphingomonas natans TaxID=3063330 RepID=A0ABT8Y4G4_9SPHN|nr:bestrophin family ion channel [Sphingomonas sp. BIUV-7]MDO6413215.1 bestrophin family ion channel [Sphingomonas sp. BIUV-7]